MSKMKLKTLPKMLEDVSPLVAETAKTIKMSIDDVNNILSGEELIRLALILLFSHGFITANGMHKFNESLKEDLT